MSDITLVHSGFDTIHVAIMGALDRDTLALLEAALQTAKSTQEPQFVRFGPGGFEAHVQPHGMQGGYAFLLNSGEEKIAWAIVNNHEAGNWNFFAKGGSDCVLTLGFDGFRSAMFRDLKAMGARYGAHSVNRVDFAMDFRVAGLTLDKDNIVCHSRSGIQSFVKEEAFDSNGTLVDVTRGKRTESLTIGKMPGRQIILYDKRRQAIVKNKRHWFGVWGIDPNDRGHDIYRVEIRFGKKHLSETWGLVSLSDIQDTFGDMVQDAIHKVRYLADASEQWEKNVTRQKLHPLWEAVQVKATQIFESNRIGLLPGQMRQHYREQKIAAGQAAVIGFAASLLVALGLDEESAVQNAPEIIRDTIKSYLASEDNRDSFRGKIKRKREQCRFIETDRFDVERYRRHVMADYTLTSGD